MNWEKFQAAYQMSSPQVKSFIDSEEIGNFIETQISSKKIPLGLKSEILIIITDLSLGLLTKQELGNNLIEIGIPFESSHTLYEEIIFFLEQKGFDFGKKNDVVPISTNVSQNLTSEISTTEKELASIQTVRTMSHDMAAIRPGSDVVYQSSQADILRSPAPMAPSPAPETPRWDTDTKQ